MFKIGDRIRLRSHIIKEYQETGLRPYYFNKYGHMDYLLEGTPATVVRSLTTDSLGRARVMVKAQEKNNIDGIWSLVAVDCEAVKVDNRKIESLL